MDAVKCIWTLLSKKVGHENCSSASMMKLKSEIYNLRKELGRKISELEETVVRIASDHRCVHPGLLRGVLARRGLQTDLGLLWLVLRRYRERGHVWCTLANLLIPVLLEIKREMDRLDKDIWTSADGIWILPELDNFLKRYDGEVAGHFAGSEVDSAFELRLADLLLTCPCGNLTVTLTNGSVHVYFELRNPSAGVLLRPPSVGRHRALADNQAEILAFFRKNVREVTRDLIKEMYDKMEYYGKRIDELVCSGELEEMISFISCGDESSVLHTTGPGGESYQLYSARDIGRCCLRYSFQIRHPPPTCNPSQVSNSQNLSEVTCVSCTYPIKTTSFELGIMLEGKNPFYAEEVVICFDPDNGNYNLIKKQHWNI